MAYAHYFQKNKIFEKLGSGALIDMHFSATLVPLYSNVKLILDLFHKQKFKSIHNWQKFNSNFRDESFANFNYRKMVSFFNCLPLLKTVKSCCTKIVNKLQHQSHFLYISFYAFYNSRRLKIQFNSYRIFITYIWHTVQYQIHISDWGM